MTLNQHKVGETTFNERLMYKVYVYDSETHDISEILVESKEKANQIAKMMTANGFHANVNIHSWCVLTEV